MIKLRNTTQIMIMVVLLALNYLCTANEIPSKIEIDSLQKSIKVGDPLFLKLVYKYNKPQVSHTTREISENITHFAYLKIEHYEGNFSTDRFPIFPMELLLQNTEGLEYNRQFVFLYHPGEKRLLFPKPGTYKVTVRGRTRASNPLNITVEPASELQKKALSLLSDPNDYLFLEFGEHEFRERRSKRMSNLKKVVEQCEETILAKWAAARLGLEYFKDFQEKNPSLQKFKSLRKNKKVKEPLFEQAKKYLELGAALPDRFPIREDSLRQLMRIKYVDGDYAEAISILDEMGTKYPKGRYGRNAVKWKERLLEEKKREQKK